MDRAKATGRHCVSNSMALLPGHHYDSCVWMPGEAISLYMPNQISCWAVTCFSLANEIIWPPLWLTLCHQDSIPHCVHHCSVRVIYIQCDRSTLCTFLFIMSEWSLSYTVNSWSVCPFCCQVHICTTGLIVTPPPSSPVTTATVFTFPSETSFTSIPVVGGIL